MYEGSTPKRVASSFAVQPRAAFISDRACVRFFSEIMLTSFLTICTLSIMQSNPLSAAVEVVTPHFNDPDQKQALIAAKIYGLLHGYASRWNDAPMYRIDAVESVLSSPLPNPATGRTSRSFMSAGKLDVRATEIATGQKIIIDHKTTSEALEDPNSDYWRKLVVEGQPSHYFLLEHLNGGRADKAIWNCIRRPSIRPKALTKAQQVEFTEKGTYSGVPFDAEERARFLAQEEPRETNWMYAYRLLQDCSNDRPNFYFARKTVPRLDNEIYEYSMDQWDHAQTILEHRRNSRWPRISTACTLHNSTCVYLPLCSGHSTLEDGKWAAKPFMHPELELNEIGGIPILTNSAMQTLVCPRKYYYRYERGIERFEEEEWEVLFFGNLWHEAMDVFYTEMKKDQGVTCG